MLGQRAGCNLRSLSHALALIGFLLVADPSAFSGEAPGKANQEPQKKAEGPSFQVNKKEPIFITSNWMEADHKKNTITYKGRVVVVQADMTMRSETLTAYYDPNMQQLKEAVAEGKVSVVQGARTALGAKAVFSGNAQTITLTGNPVVRQGNNEVSGNRIIFFIVEDRAVVEGGSDRVKATIFPEEFGSSEKKEETPGKSR